MTDVPERSNRAPMLIGLARRQFDIDTSPMSERTARVDSSLPVMPIAVRTGFSPSGPSAPARSPNATTIGVTSVPATGAGHHVEFVTAPVTCHEALYPTRPPTCDAGL